MSVTSKSTYSVLVKNKNARVDGRFAVNVDGDITLKRLPDTRVVIYYYHYHRRRIGFRIFRKRVRRFN